MKSLLHYWLLAIFVATGLLLSPLAVAPARDMPFGGQSMADEMPGCPGPMTPDECHKCPLMVVCLVKSVANPADFTLGDAIGHSRIAMHPPGNDSLPNGLGHSPPARPPRSPVIPA